MAQICLGLFWKVKDEVKKQWGASRVPRVAPERRMLKIERLLGKAESYYSHSAVQSSN